MSDESEDKKEKPLDPFDPEVIARSNRAILVGLQRPDDTAEEAQMLLDELHELVGNVGVEIRGSIIAKLREENPRTLVGSGKLEEIAQLARDKECGLIIFDDELTPAQQRNWEKDAKLRAIDRQEIILDIFITRAKTREAVLQVELAALQAYLDVEKVRWRERLQIEFDVAPEVEAVQLPPFLLLPLVENAIKHGARTTPERMRLRIRAFRLRESDEAKPEAAPDAVVIEIINSGEWLSPEPNRPGSTGIGLENLRQRLQRHYPNAHTFTTEAQNGWVTVRVQLSPGALRTGGAAPLTETTAAS